MVNDVNNLGVALAIGIVVGRTCSVLMVGLVDFVAGRLVDWIDERQDAKQRECEQREQRGASGSLEDVA